MHRRIKQILIPGMLIVGISQHVCAESYSEAFMRVHRDLIVSSNGYAEAISRELGIHLVTVKDYLNLHALFISEHVAAKVALEVIKALSLKNPGKYESCLSIATYYHQLVYLIVSAFEYLTTKPVSFLSNLALYHLLWNLCNGRHVPITSLTGNAGWYTK